MLRLRAALAATALIALLATPVASAHQGNPNYRSVIRAVAPDVDGLKLEVLNFDDRMEVLNRTGQTVVIDGYEGEPYVRLKADGTVEMNRRSPATHLNDDRFGQVKVPVTADRDATPQWQVLDRTGRFEWHDHRIHWMSKIPPKQIGGAESRTKIFDWSVPVAVGDTAGAVRGTLFWQPPDESGPPVGAYLGFGGIAMLGLAVVVLVRRRRRPEPGEQAAAHPKAEAW